MGWAREISIKATNYGLGKDLRTFRKSINKPSSPPKKVGKVIENHLLYRKWNNIYFLPTIFIYLPIYECFSL